VFNEIRRADVPCVGALSAEEVAHLAAFGELPGGVDLKGRATALDLLKVGGLGRGVPWGAAAGKSYGEQENNGPGAGHVSGSHTRLPCRKGITNGSTHVPCSDMPGGGYSGVWHADRSVQFSVNSFGPRRPTR
jgi:hypothetical protein